MELFVFTIFLISGVIIGSFLNVLIDRLSTSRPVLNSRSVCDSCDKQLKWFELFPLFSYIVQKGRCRHCKAKIPLRLFIVELLNGVLYAALFFWFSPFYPLVVIVLALIVTSCLLVIFQADVEYGIIPDQMLVAIIVCALLYLVFFAQAHIIQHLILAGICFLIFFLLFAATSGRGMGFGDVKFAFVIGLLLGYPGSLIAIYFAFLVGAVISILLIVTGKKKFKKDSIPFGPFLVLGIALYYLFGSHIASFLHVFGL